MTAYPLSKLLLASAASALAMLTCAAGQSSLEQIPVTGSDVAAELGLVMTKFKARFAEPVYCKVKMEIKPIGGREVIEVETRSPTSERTTEILFSIKDLEFVTRQLGLMEQGLDTAEIDTVIPVAFTIKANTFSTKHYAISPFGSAMPGTSFFTWSPQHSTENLPLDQDIPIFIKAGPYLRGRAQKVKDILQEYVLASGYVRLTVRFSREPLPTKKEVEAETERRQQLEAVLAKFDELVEKATADGEQSKESASGKKDE
ncbi:MAG: hypothetical protein R3F19_07935 [Verrucomicrobiales bacterium]